MSDVFVLTGEMADLEDVIAGRPVEMRQYIHSVHETAGSAHVEREKQLQQDYNKYQRMGQNVRVADSTTHLLLGDVVLFRYAIQRARYVPKVQKKTPGRRKTTGKFDTREQLAEYACFKYFSSECNVAQIARQCKVSPGVVDSLVNEHGQAYKKEHGIE